jgi:hypothetical protein
MYPLPSFQKSAKTFLDTLSIDSPKELTSSKYSAKLSSLVLNPSPILKVVFVLKIALCVEALLESSDNSCGNRLLLPKGIHSSLIVVNEFGSFGGSAETSFEKE